jgi:hypothetical protein
MSDTGLTVADTPTIARSADVGVFLSAEIIHPIRGRLRASPGWLETALYCDPEDSTPFIWQLEKVANGAIALGTTEIPGHPTLYASVRDDDEWLLQLQAPESLDWITQAQRDEEFAVVGQDLLFCTIRGFNGRSLAVDGILTSISPRSGYRVRSVGTSITRSALWFVTPGHDDAQEVLREERIGVASSPATTSLDSLASAAAAYPE